MGEDRVVGGTAALDDERFAFGTELTYLSSFKKEKKCLCSYLNLFD